MSAHASLAVGVTSNATGRAICHWSGTQASVALSPGGGDLNSAVKVCLRALGVYNAASQRTLHRDRSMIPCVDANACKGILLRTGTGRVNHASTKQLWVQGAYRATGWKCKRCLAPKRLGNSNSSGGRVGIERGPPADGVPHTGRECGSPVSPLQCWASAATEPQGGAL